VADTLCFSWSNRSILARGDSQSPGSNLHRKSSIGSGSVNFQQAHWVGSMDPALWEAGKEPQVMGAKTRRDGPASLNLSILTHHTAITTRPLTGVRDRNC
jgi:hypothetical protein